MFELNISIMIFWCFFFTEHFQFNFIPISNFPNNILRIKANFGENLSLTKHFRNKTQRDRNRDRFDLILFYLQQNKKDIFKKNIHQLVHQATGIWFVSIMSICYKLWWWMMMMMIMLKIMDLFCGGILLKAQPC